MAKILDQFKSEEELLKLTPAQLLQEHDKWQSIMTKHQNRFNKEENDERAMLIVEEVDRIADYLEEVKERAQTNAAYYEEERAKVEETCVKELNMQLEPSNDEPKVAIVPDAAPDVIEDVYFDEIDDFHVEIEVASTEVKTSKRKKQTKAEKEAKKNSETAAFVKEKLEQLPKDKKTRKPGKLAQNPTDRTSDFNEPAMTRKAAPREPGEKKGDWYQVSFRTPKENKAQIKEFANGLIPWLTGIIKPIGIYISYCAEAIFLADYENRMYWSTDRRQQQLKRSIKFTKMYLDGGHGMPQFEIDNVERNFHYFKCDTDYKKQMLVAKYERELNSLNEIAYYEFVIEQREFEDKQAIESAQEIMDEIDDKMDTVDETNDENIAS